MPPTRESLFPSASIGRSGSSQLQRVASHESLSAHPLLSNSTSSSESSNLQSNQEASTSPTPRYVPYTPRHRPPPSSATTSTTTHSSVPVSHQLQQGGATSKLQLQNLKAAAQGIGLGSGTVGWAILEKLVERETGSDWDEIWTAIIGAKPVLLLPLEPFSGEVITPEFVRDHVAFCNGPALSTSPLVTLSGLRGFINDSTLTLQSSIPVGSESFLRLLKPETQSSTLMSLPPLPFPLSPTTHMTLPSFALPATASLPLPPRLSVSKPPLPPRPGVLSSTPLKPPGASRITNPFASLFARPPPSPTASVVSTSPSQSSLIAEEVHPVSNVGTEITAFSIGKKVVKKSLGKELSNVIKDEIKGGLGGCPAWVIDRVYDFTGPLHPVPRSSKRIEIRRTSSVHTRASSSLPPSTHPSSDPSVLADAFQIFYASIEEDLRATAPGSPLFGRKKEERKASSQDHDDSGLQEHDATADSKDNERRESEAKETDVRIRDVLEQVERVVCSVFYDRAFRPLSGDDASHDDALANRIAALNMLDLGLEHLGVEVPTETIKSDVDTVIKACGEILQRLEDSEHRSPADKSALLVEAHKTIVDGLSRLPQLLLKPEQPQNDQEQKTPRASSFGKQAAEEAIDEASTSSRPDPNMANSELTGIGMNSPPSLEASNRPDISEGFHLTTAQPSEPVQDPTEILESPAAEMSRVDTEDVPSRETDSSRRPSSAQSASTTSRPSTPTTVSGDLLFPLLIFSVVKANPTHLVSHLLFTQRFRSRSAGGQESYCLINLMAVVEFLEHVDMSALGLGDSERVMSTEDLTPIPLAHGSIDSSTSPSSPLSSRLGKRMNQQVEELAGLAGSANKVITGVVDSSFGVLRGFLTSNPDLSTPHSEMQDTAPWNNMKPGFGLLRRGSGFSIAGVAASLPGAGKPKTPGGSTGEEGQQLIEVSSRPGSIKGMVGLEEEEGHSVLSEESSEESPEGEAPDTRSVRSFSSMMSRESKDRDRAEGKERLSLTDRLANMSGRSRLGSSPGEEHGAKGSPPASRPTSWLPPPAGASTAHADTPASSGASSPSHPKVRIPPPHRRFLECAAQDIRVGEVGELLQEYQRLAQALQAAGAFEDP